LKIIPYSKQSISEEDIDAVCSVLRSDWLTQGPKVKEFEEALSKQCGAKHCIVVANGTVALLLACMALEIGPGDNGLTSPISFLASANCIAYCGGKVDFVDIDPDTLCLSPDNLEEYCKRHGAPKVVIPVDFAGIPADLPQFKKLADKYGFILIEDAAHSIGSTYTYDGQEYSCGSCTHTDLAILSFHPVKTITTGEGGAILTNDDELAQRLRCLANHGIERDASRFVNPHSESRIPHSDLPWYYEMHLLGYNGRITDIQCALGLSQLKRIDGFKTKRQQIVKKYNQSLKELEKEHIVILPPWPHGTDPCYHLYPLRLGPNAKIKRDELFMRLREKGIYCQVHYIPIYRQPFYQNQYKYHVDQCPEAETYFASCISLPLFPDLDEGSFHFIIEKISSLIVRCIQKNA